MIVNSLKIEGEFEPSRWRNFDLFRNLSHAQLYLYSKVVINRRKVWLKIFCEKKKKYPVFSQYVYF